MEASHMSYYDTRTNAYHANRSTLPASRDNITSLRNAPDEWLAQVGILLCVTDDVPAGHVRIGWRYEVGESVVHRIPVTITQEEYEAQQQAIEQARIAGLVELIGDAVTNLVNLLAGFGVQLPTDLDEAQTIIYAAGKADSSKVPDGVLALSVYNTLKSRGISDDDIYAVAQALELAN